MKTLSETWFTEGYIDFELKKYTLLAYLNTVSKVFDQNIRQADRSAAENSARTSRTSH